MDLYYDGFIILKENTEENYAIYANFYMDFFQMSIPVARFIAKKLKENLKHGYFLLDCMEAIYRKRGYTYGN